MATSYFIPITFYTIIHFFIYYPALRAPLLHRRGIFQFSVFNFQFPAFSIFHFHIARVEHDDEREESPVGER